MTIRFPCVPAFQRSSSNGLAERSAPRLVGPVGARAAGLPRSGVTVPPGPPDAKMYGRLILHDYETCEAQYPGAIFAMAVTAANEVEFFSHAPYERYGATEHAKLSPMFFEATARGRLEPDEEKRPTLTLKAPQSLREFFEFKNVAEEDRSAAMFGRMVREEYIRVARKLLETGMPADTVVLVDRLREFFPDEPELANAEPFSLDVLAGRPLAEVQEG